MAKVTHPDDVRERDAEEYEVIVTFEAIYTSTCVMDNRHEAKKGTRVGRVSLIANPLVPIPGVACASCTKSLPRARRR